MKWWNKEVFEILDVNIEKIIKDRNELKDAAASGEVVDTGSIKALIADLWQQLNYRESLLAQKSWAKWIAEGDANTRYFYICVNNYRRRIQIVKLKKGDQ